MNHLKLICTLMAAALAAAFCAVDASAQFKEQAFSQQYNDDPAASADSTDVLFSFKEYFAGLRHDKEIKIGTMTGGSALIIGGSQIYNRQAWKVPIIYGAFATVGYFIHYNYTRMDMFKTEYLYRVNNDGATQLEGYESYPTNNIYNLYNSYNRNFQLMIIIAAGVYALNLIDAYVFGHLFDFQIDNNLAMSLSPSVAPLPTGLHPTLGLTFSF